MKLRAVLTSVVALAACGDDDNDLGGLDAAPVASARDFTLRIENVAPWTMIRAGSVTTMTNQQSGFAGPGRTFEVRFNARDHLFLSFATMLGESNDWFFAPDPQGIPLFTNGRPTAGDITRFVKLWNAGTEIDQEPAVGDATRPRQPSSDFGAPDPDDTVRELPVTVPLADGSTFVRPAVDRMIRVTLTPGPDQQFTLRIQNISNAMTLQTSQGAIAIHISPITFAVSEHPAPLFSAGSAASPGLAALAEHGAVDPFDNQLRPSVGFATPLSPGVFVVHDQLAPLYLPGSPDYGLGLEALAEDGNPLPLRDALAATPPTGASSTGVFETPVGASAPGPAQPGQAFEVSIRGAPGEAVSFASMFGMSNDWFFGTRVDGIRLFDGDTPRTGDVTSEVMLFDAGTERDEDLAIGPQTAPQQPAPDTGADDGIVVVRQVTADRYSKPVAEHVRVTLTPQ